MGLLEPVVVLLVTMVAKRVAAVKLLETQNRFCGAQFKDEQVEPQWSSEPLLRCSQSRYCGSALQSQPRDLPEQVRPQEGLALKTIMEIIN